MSLKHIFDGWAKEIDGKYKDQQWLLSKWDTLEGVHWQDDKIELLSGHIRTYLGMYRSEYFLDVGCGGGWILDKFGDGPSVSVGCDISLEMLKNVSGNFPIVNADVCFMPFKDESFDHILCYFVFINFMDMFLVEEAIAQMVRVLKPGGKILIGQLPDREKSAIYDQEKKRYLEYCQQHFSVVSDTRDVCSIPIQLFDRISFEQIATRLGCKASIIAAFNPFYRSGESEHVSWRFDVVIEK